MCPLRFILIFFSGLLAAYLAWRTMSSSSPELNSGDSPIEPEVKEGNNFKRKIENGFWVFVDMASGRYLWRNMKEMREKTQ